MILPYNSLYPYLHSAIRDDEYVKSCTARIVSHKNIIYSNIEGAKVGLITFPCLIVDVDADNFVFHDISGVQVSDQIVRVVTDNGWTDVVYTGNIPNTEEVYQRKGKVVFIQTLAEPILYNRSICGSAEIDGEMFSKTYYERLEFLYNMRVGGTFIKSDQSITSFDSATGDLVTDSGEYKLLFPASFMYNTGDTIPAGTICDAPITIELDPPYVRVKIKSEYSYIKNILSFDSNKVVEIIN
jgi:hypothetical protein